MSVSHTHPGITWPSRLDGAIAKSLQPFFIVSLGLFLAIGFHTGELLPIRAIVLLLMVSFVWAMVGCRLTRRTLLPRFLILVYAMPFSAMVGYLIQDNYVWASTPRQIEIARDPRLMAELITLGVIGLLGFFAGVIAARQPQARATPVGNVRKYEARLPLAVYIAALLASLFLSWLSAPPETIFRAQYALGQSAAPAAGLNFAAAYLVSYIILIALFIDAERERSQALRRLKIIGLTITVGYIVVVLQLLRGDRESSGLVVALIALLLTSPRKAGISSARVWRRRLRLVMLPVAAIVVVYIALGQARSTFSEASETIPPKQLFLLGLSQNTWTAVLWRNLGVAWEYRTGILHFKRGETYVGYLLSLPPGVVAKAIGYERPEEGWRGISWEDPAGVSAGGLHAVIAPFKNFGAVGVLAILMAYGFFVGRLELSQARGSFIARLMWASVLCCGFLWFWYGDMAFIRAMMIAGLVYFVYKLAIRSRYITPWRKDLVPRRVPVLVMPAAGPASPGGLPSNRE
jgi:hypothetical protein